MASLKLSTPAQVQQTQAQQTQAQQTQAQKYITPSKRNTNTNNTNTNNKTKNMLDNTSSLLDNKSLLDSKSLLDKQDFPTLGETMKTPAKKVMNFASAAQKVEQKIEIKPIVSDIKPGWIHIRMINGKIQYRHNMINKDTLEEEIKEDKMIGDYLFKKRVTIQQWERDVQNELLGDLSPYWNAKTVLEIHDSDNDNDKYYDDDENYSSEYSDSYD